MNQPKAPHLTFSLTFNGGASFLGLNPAGFLVAVDMMHGTVDEGSLIMPTEEEMSDQDYTEVYVPFRRDYVQADINSGDNFDVTGTILDVVVLDPPDPDALLEEQKRLIAKLLKFQQPLGKQLPENKRDDLKALAKHLTTMTMSFEDYQLALARLVPKSEFASKRQLDLVTAWQQKLTPHIRHIELVGKGSQLRLANFHEGWDGQVTTPIEAYNTPAGLHREFVHRFMH